jgi:hypothetical protein
MAAADVMRLGESLKMRVAVGRRDVAPASASRNEDPCPSPLVSTIATDQLYGNFASDVARARRHKRRSAGS